MRVFTHQNFPDGTLVAHKDELEGLLATMFSQQRPEIVGNDYLVIGTIDRKTWKEGVRCGTVDELRVIVRDFKRYLHFEPTHYQWVLEEK